MDRSEIIKKPVSKMEGPFTQVCEKVYGLLKGLGFVIQEETMVGRTRGIKSKYRAIYLLEP